MLILAGITISLVFSENGIVAKAQDAVEKTKVTSIEEQLNLAKLYAKINKNGEIDLDEYFQSLEDTGIINNKETDIVDNGDGSYEIITTEGYVFEVTIGEDGNIEIGYLEKSDEIRISKLNIFKTNNSIKVEVKTINAEGATYTYSYKESGAENWIETNKDTEKTYTFDNLKSNTMYNIKVKVEKGEKSIEKEESVFTGEEIIGGEFNIEKGVNTPKYNQTEMTPIKWNGNSWIKTTENDSEWYDYSSKKWANIVVGGSFSNEGILDENSNYSMFVWIPRYAYSIPTGYHEGGSIIKPDNVIEGAGTIEIEFLKNTTNEGATGKGIVKYNSVTTSNYTQFPLVNGENGYVVHPAFLGDASLGGGYGNNNVEDNGVPGIWVAKFEASIEGASKDVTSNEYNGTDKKMQVKPGVSSWRNISVSNIYDVCLNYNQTLNSHLIKNSEWGAVTYLSKSKYGKETEEVWINNSGTYITGSSGDSAIASLNIGTDTNYKSLQGQEASTTGTIWGIYDMNGGAWEYVAAYVDNKNEALADNGLSLVHGANYTKNTYEIGEKDYSSDNYKVAKEKYGDAIHETSVNGNLAYGSWYGDYSLFPYENGPFFIRSGTSNDGQYAGVYTFVDFSGTPSSSMSFRPTLIII